MPKEKSIRIELPEKYHAGLAKARKSGRGSKRLVAKHAIMKQLIEDGFVRPDKMDKLACGIK